MNTTTQQPQSARQVSQQLAQVTRAFEHLRNSTYKTVRLMRDGRHVYDDASAGRQLQALEQVTQAKLRASQSLRRLGELSIKAVKHAVAASEIRSYCQALASAAAPVSGPGNRAQALRPGTVSPVKALLDEARSWDVACKVGLPELGGALADYARA